MHCRRSSGAFGSPGLTAGSAVDAKPEREPVGLSAAGVASAPMPGSTKGVADGAGVHSSGC